MTTAIVSQNQNGITNYSGVETDVALINLWIRSKGSEKTRITYQTSIQDFFGYIGIKPLASITASDLEEYKQHLFDCDYSISTVRVRLASIKSLLNYAARTGYIQHNVGVVVTKPKASNTLAERILDESEVMQLLNASKVAKTKLMAHVLYYTGIREGELINLKWKDVQKTGERYQITVTESKSEPRSIVLADKVTKMLLEYRPKDAQPNDFVFPGRPPKGTSEMVKLTEMSVYLTIKRLGEKVGIKASPHMLRHSHGTHSLRRGADIATVKATLGHANIATTNNYVHARPNESSSLYLPE